MLLRNPPPQHITIDQTRHWLRQGLDASAKIRAPPRVLFVWLLPSARTSDKSGSSQRRVAHGREQSSGRVRLLARNIGQRIGSLARSYRAAFGIRGLGDKEHKHRNSPSVLFRRALSPAAKASH